MTKTHFKVVLLDETKNYTEEFVKLCGGRIMRAFLFDSLQETNCCEITPSYALIPLYSSCPIELPGAVEAELRQLDANDNDIQYKHCYLINAYPAERFSEFNPYTLRRDQSYDEVEAEYEEDARCNEKIACPWAEEVEYG